MHGGQTGREAGKASLSEGRLEGMYVLLLSALFRSDSYLEGKKSVPSLERSYPEPALVVELVLDMNLPLGGESDEYYLDGLVGEETFLKTV